MAGRKRSGTKKIGRSTMCANPARKRVLSQADIKRLENHAKHLNDELRRKNRP